MSKNKSSRGSKTAAELMAELEANPAYVAERDRRDAELQRKAEEWLRAETPLAEELREAGYEVSSAWDLVNTSVPYPAALPILLAHLERPYPDRVREGIARALAVRDARFGWEKLVQLYRLEKADTDAKAGLAVALAAASDDGVLEDLASLARDSTHGESRLLLLRGLSRSSSPRAVSALEEIVEDPVLGQEARRLLSGGS